MTDDPFNLSADLPPPHESEPASLRQDILDELADHLACSLRREAVLTPDENQARRNVLKRFGNPAGVARKLWRDAMWEKIMLQKLSLGLSLVSMMAIVVVGLVLWRMVEQSNASQAEMLSQFKLSQQEILSQLTRSQADMAHRQQEFASSILGTLKSQPASKTSHENWGPLDIELLDEGGRPVKGTVRVISLKDQAAIPPTDMYVEANSQGISSLGQLAFGKYELTVTLADLPLSTTWQHLLRPGEPSKLTILCPTTVPEGDVAFDIQPPEDLIRQGVCYRASFTERLNFQGRRWSVKVAMESLFLFDSHGKSLGQIVRSIGLKHSDFERAFGQISRSNNPVILMQNAPEFLHLLGLGSQAELPNSEEGSGTRMIFHGMIIEGIADIYRPSRIKLRGNDVAMSLVPEFYCKSVNDTVLPSWMSDEIPPTDCLISLKTQRSFGISRSFVPQADGHWAIQIATDSPEWDPVISGAKEADRRLRLAGYERIPAGEAASK